MIDLYTWTTPNGRKVSILLEELGVPYTVHAIDIGKDDQFAPEFLKISPNNKIPAIVDREADLALMESGAIMLYLGQKYGRFISQGDDYWSMMEWLMWQMGGFGPMLGQAHHFLKFNKGTSDYAEARYGKEAARLYSVLDTRLEGRSYVAGDYSIADMAIFPWAARFEWQEINLNDFPNVREWYLRIANRPAAQRGYQVPKFVTGIPMP
ncbi:glutathione S-transferase family protein [Marivita geojedonensis]|uniref:Glutathione S-transferase n=1 Tax=Marivita geojedonensis TaxID=1123756 RepID=A0A1X4NRF9_9RHOB|nr:glutathione S-transferase N-terminal domain-containing protein [Marivita geojedonensis]OSQ53471.1 glutathione S-transferase [Marivita geojedonensis]PRY81537.1 GST-like protein [Marivita geojedonensis]